MSYNPIGIFTQVPWWACWCGDGIALGKKYTSGLLCDLYSSLKTHWRWWLKACIQCLLQGFIYKIYCLAIGSTMMDYFFKVEIRGITYCVHVRRSIWIILEDGLVVLWYYAYYLHRRGNIIGHDPGLCIFFKLTLISSLDQLLLLYSVLVKIKFFNILIYSRTITPLLLWFFELWRCPLYGLVKAARQNV